MTQSDGLIAAKASASERDARRAALMDRARELHARFPLIDGHNDLPWALREGFDYKLSEVDLESDQSGVRWVRRLALTIASSGRTQTHAHGRETEARAKDFFRVARARTRTVAKPRGQ